MVRPCKKPKSSIQTVQGSGSRSKFMAAQLRFAKLLRHFLQTRLEMFAHETQIQAYLHRHLTPSVCAG